MDVYVYVYIYMYIHIYARARVYYIHIYVSATTAQGGKRANTVGLKLAMPEGFLLPEALESSLSDKLLNM